MGLFLYRRQFGNYSFADNYLSLAHNQNMNKIQSRGPLLSTGHCSLPTEGYPPPPYDIFFEPQNLAD
jgi:hypothetical protein